MGCLALVGLGWDARPALPRAALHVLAAVLAATVLQEPSFLQAAGTDPTATPLLLTTLSAHCACGPGNRSTGSSAATAAWPASRCPLSLCTHSAPSCSGRGALGSSALRNAFALALLAAQRSRVCWRGSGPGKAGPACMRFGKQEQTSLPPVRLRLCEPKTCSPVACPVCAACEGSSPAATCWGLAHTGGLERCGVGCADCRAKTHKADLASHNIKFTHCSFVRSVRYQEATGLRPTISIVARRVDCFANHETPSSRRQQLQHSARSNQQVPSVELLGEQHGCCTPGLPRSRACSPGLSSATVWDEQQFIRQRVGHCPRVRPCLACKRCFAGAVVGLHATRVLISQRSGALLSGSLCAASGTCCVLLHEPERPRNTVMVALLCDRAASSAAVHGVHCRVWW